ncbi:MAG: tRNA (N6-isopentenyl adenosine(37)-C2)-methylthiotransferase MiaB [Campylobacteraceae bacterium]|nr:tRNA (N6-isopentenyl adenosine(37)-C2)-methylthiotransferase MiaB [Campylobacteraceae bacterium]MBT3882351.1 tRNA (N6-isopentenyl adenosine(37)-C2)-methylthiotransferase MiaB [Campylobacteraceae bacterium]MBT4031235.1 tRNA (N6-isopentenyl adenosine(37)-C2)-methylthiotransferase MiaB [Campylobacteraceae bacterium]MBT4178937.1 tRNA (N6-isopentenyl adenosine(37)-C2)-methylthiotransferase MiaB [Campylobacteraceae bacterium]MBT4573148.1 tRNA (N6-isopentenyl adenosine(37)-C2)-methylthiotransferase
MNTRDTEHIIAELNSKDNYETTEDVADADLIIINTCSVREKPVAKLFSELGQFKKKKKPNAKVGVCGCTASHLGKEIIKKAPYVDFVVGARNVSKISEAVQNKGTVEIDINHDETDYEFAQYRNSLYKVSVNISLGCDKKCTFCIVPATRGEEISIPPELIIGEIQKAVDNGAKEVFLLGQNVNNYGKNFSDGRDKFNFTKLLQAISEIEKLERIRFTSPHPLHMDNEFIAEFASNPKICKQIHVPLQAGSTKVLKDMKRGYTKEWFIDRCQRIKSLVPEVRISTDIIVGFPGETNEEFKDTIDVINTVKFDQIFNFKYSPRPETEALHMSNQVEDDIASARLEEVIALHKNHQVELMQENVGKTMNVFFEELKPNGEIMGFSDNYCQIFVEASEELLGCTVPIKIIHANRTSLKGEVVAKEN